MAYGTPDRPDEVEAYYTHIRGGKTPSAAAVERLRARYELVGGRTPLLGITLALARAVEQELHAMTHERTHVAVGMKHWHPFIGDVIPRLAAEGVTELTAIALAPHYSRISIGGYRRAVEEAVTALGGAMSVTFVDHWHLHPLFTQLVATRVTEALAHWPASQRGQVVTLFSAHSLPVRIREWNDPYEAQLLESCRAVAELAGLDHWRFAWQSAGETGEPWLGPDICEVIRSLHADGARHVLSVPIGFVSDHLEIFYDIDHEAGRTAEVLGVTLRRTRMPNADPDFARLIARVAVEAETPAARGAWAS